MVWDTGGRSMFPYCSPVPTVIRLLSVAVIKAPLGRPQNITGLMQGSIPHDNHNCEMRTMPRGGPVTRTTPEAQPLPRRRCGTRPFVGVLGGELFVAGLRVTDLYRAPGSPVLPAKLGGRRTSRASSGQRSAEICRLERSRSGRRLRVRIRRH